MANTDLKKCTGTDLIRAIVELDLKKVKELCNAENRRILITDDGGNTAIHWLCSGRCSKFPPEKRSEMLTAMLKYVPTDLIDIRNLQGNSPLHLATSSGFVECVELILRKGANLNETGQQDMLPITMACIAGRLPMIDLLLKHGGAYSKTSKGETIVHQIFQHWKPDKNKRLSETDVSASDLFSSVFNRLLDAGSDVNCPTHHHEMGGGYMPLHAAAEYGHLAGVQLLLKHNAYVNDASPDEKTPLMYAVWKGHVHIAKALIEAGANTYHIMVKGDSVLHIACANTIYKWSSIVEDIEQVSLTLNNQLKYDKEECVNLLVQFHQNHVNLKNERGLTPLLRAAESGLNRAIRILVDNGSSIHTCDATGRTVLHHILINYADEKTIAENLEYLIRKGADIHCRDLAFDTLLHYACRRMPSVHERVTTPEQIDKKSKNEIILKRPVICALIRNKLDVNIKGHNGNTPLHVACTMSVNCDVVKLLIIHGANIFEKNNDGLYPRDMTNTWIHTYLQFLMIRKDPSMRISISSLFEESKQKVLDKQKCVCS